LTNRLGITEPEIQQKVKSVTQDIRSKQDSLWGWGVQEYRSNVSWPRK